MNTYLRWFSILTWIGVPINLYFAVPALFVPEFVVDMLDLDPGFHTVWLRNAGLLIFIITFNQIAAALAPARYPLISWLAIGGRLSAAVYWLIVALDVMDISSAPSSFIPFLIGDATFGTVTGVLLFLGLGRLGLRHREKVDDT